MFSEILLPLPKFSNSSCLKPLNSISYLYLVPTSYLFQSCIVGICSNSICLQPFTSYLAYICSNFLLTPIPYFLTAGTKYTLLTLQVYDDIPPFSAQQAPDAQDSFSYHQNNEHAYRSGFMPYNEVLKAVLSPNMTVSLTR